MDLRDFKNNIKNSMIYSDYLITKYGLIFIPVPIVKVAVGEGLKVFEIEFLGEKKGFSAYTKLDEKSIFINTKLPIEQKRFAIAQQLGLYLFNKDNKYKTLEINEKSDSLTTAINMFAANLLVPTLTIKIKSQEFKNSNCPEKIIAKEFKVTENVIHFKLSMINDMLLIRNEITDKERIKTEPITDDEKRKLLMKVDDEIKESIINELGKNKKNKLNDLFNQLNEN